MRQKNGLLKRVLVLAVLTALTNPGLCPAGNLLCDAERPERVRQSNGVTDSR
jgi:hypothetical protein